MKLLCLGDSNTYGYDPRSYFGSRYPEKSCWTGLLDGWEVINCGMNGLVVPTDSKVWKNLIESRKPDPVTVMLGSNDLKDTFHASPQEISNGAGTLIEVIQTFTKEKQGFVDRKSVV